MAPVGVIPLLGGVAEVFLTFFSLGWSWWLSLGESLDSVLDRHDGGVLGVVPLLGASCLEAWLGSSLLSSGVHRRPLLILSGAMYGRRRCVQDVDFLGSDQVLPSTCHLLSVIQGGWCVDERSSVGAGGLRVCPTLVETRC